MKRLNAFRRSSILVIMMILGLAVAGEAQVRIKERVEIADGDAEFQAGTQSGKKPWNLTGSASEVIQPATYFACDVLPNDPSYVPCPTVLELADWSFPCPCDMAQGTCGAAPYTWIASMNNHDTSAQTFTFQNSLEQIVKSAVYNEGAGAFLIDLALVSHNWFGVADFTVTLYNAAGPRCGWGGQIVIDDDNDLIPDTLEKEFGGMERPMTRVLEGCEGPSDACYDDDGIGNPLLGEGMIGDGISKLDEYRGIYTTAGYTRLSWDSQDIFVDVDPNLGYTAEADWALDQLHTQLGLSVHRVTGLDSVLLGGATLPWAGEESYGVFILLNDSSATSFISPADRRTGGSDEQILERLNGYIVDEGTYYWGDVRWDDETCVDDANTPKYRGCQPWEAITGGPRLGLTNRDSVAKKGVYVSTVYPNGFEAYFDPSRNSISETATLFFRYTPTTETPLTEDDFGKFWRAGYYDFDLNEDNDTDDSVSPLELLNEPVDDKNGLPLINNDPAEDGYVMRSSFSESIRRTMLHELFHALSTLGYHPEGGNSVMRQGLGPAHVDSLTADDKQEIDLRIKRGFWLIDHE